MEEKISKQINETMRKAYCDILAQDMLSDNPDYKLFINLYKEIKERLLKLVKKDSNTYKQIDQDFDIDLFKQMAENRIFHYEDLIKLVNNTFDWIKKMQTPSRDEILNEARIKVLSSNIHNIVYNFIEEIHKCIDYLYEDIAAYLEKINK